MSSRYEVEVKISSAKNVKNVNWRYGLTRPYAVVWVDPNRKCSTRSDDLNDTDPVWDETLVIPLTAPIDDETTLHIDVVHAGSEPDTKRLIGSARLPIREIVDEVGFDERADRTLKLKRPSGRPHGKLEVRVSVRDSYRRPPEPYAVGPHPGEAYYAPPTPPPPYGAPVRDPYYSATPIAAPPPPPPYGAPSTDPYYSAAPVAAPPPSGYPYSPYGSGEEEKKKGKFGGMGTGLAVGAAAGLLGGLALAEGAEYVEDQIADDAAEKVEDDLGYDDDDF